MKMMRLLLLLGLFMLARELSVRVCVSLSPVISVATHINTHIHTYIYYVLAICTHVHSGVGYTEYGCVSN